MTHSSSGQAFKESDFAQKVLLAFKSRSYDTYKQLLPDRKDFEEMVNSIYGHNKTQSESEKKKIFERFDNEADSTYRAEFKRILEKGEKRGIDWTQVKFTNFIYHTAELTNSSKLFLSGHVNFTAGGKNYILFGLEASELANGYKINSIRTVQKGGIKEYVDPDLMDDDDL